MAVIKSKIMYNYYILGDKPNSASGEESWRDVLDTDDMELLQLLTELSGM